MSFLDWASGVLRGVNAPLDQPNVDTLWAWSGAESLPRDRMSINNPLNTTQFEPGAVAFNTLPNGLHVWQYPDVATGITATVETLLNGHYPVIVDHLRRSIPRQSWNDGCANLETWGTGCTWITRDYGPAPRAPEELDMLFLKDRDKGFIYVLGDLGKRYVSGVESSVWQQSPGFTATVLTTTQLSQIPNASAAPIDTQAILVAIADLKAHPSVVSDPVVVGKLQKIEDHLNAPLPPA
jgi:hypothetical protein